MAAFVIGHMNPDTDSIVAAIAAADLYAKRGFDVVAAAQGAPTPETEFVLKKFGLTAPQVIDDVAGKDLYLVDFSDLAQAPKGMDSATVLGIVDHHKLGDVTTSSPLEAWIWPVGCTGTVLKNMYDFYGVELPKGIAGALLCALERRQLFLHKRRLQSAYNRNNDPRTRAGHLRRSRVPGHLHKQS